MTRVPAHRRKKNPFAKATLAPYVRQSTDPCMCNERCPHGDLCAGGHADYPEWHWWPTCEEGCFKPDYDVVRFDIDTAGWRCNHCVRFAGPYGSVETADREARRHVAQKHRGGEAA